MAKKATSKKVKKNDKLQRLIKFTGAHYQALEKFAREHDLMFNGQPNISAAVRLSSAIACGDPALAAGLEMGREKGTKVKPKKKQA